MKNSVWNQKELDPDHSTMRPSRQKVEPFRSRPEFFTVPPFAVEAEAEDQEGVSITRRNSAGVATAGLGATAVAPLNSREVSRLRALSRYDAEGTMREYAKVGLPELDRVAALAARICGRDAAFLALIDDEAIFTVGRFNFSLDSWSPDEIPGDWTFSARGSEPAFLDFSDALQVSSDWNWRSSSPAFLQLADGRRARSLLVVPLVSAGNHCVGVLVVLNEQTGSSTPEERQLLQDLAPMAIDALDLRAQRTRFRLDLSERNRIADQLHAAKRENFLLRAAVESSSAGIIVTEPLMGDNQIVFSNPAFQRLSGYSEQELLGLNCRFLQGPLTSGETVQQIREAIEAVREIEVTLINYNRAGEPYWNNLTINPVFDDEGQHIAYVGVQQDITARKNIESALQEAKDELEDRVRARTDDLQRLNQVLTEEIRLQKTLSAQLETSRTELRALGAHMEQLREDERQRIAREIHDELGQILTHFKMELTFLAREFGSQETNLAPRLDTIKTQIDQAIRSVRRIATDLRPSVLDRLGLCEAISWLGSDFQNRTGIRTLVHCNVNDAKLGANRATALFRITQEALTNIARHAGASFVKIDLCTKREFLVLEITDDGVGFSPENIKRKKGSLGLLGIEERAVQLGGSLQIGPRYPKLLNSTTAPTQEGMEQSEKITTTKRAGTRLVVKIPLERRRGDAE